MKRYDYNENDENEGSPHSCFRRSRGHAVRGLADSPSEGRRNRLEQIFRGQGIEAEEIDCPAIDGIIKEANVVSGEVADKSVLDAALVAAAQAVEHYEIARYGALIAWAKQLGRVDCADLLQQTLEEEKATDRKLTVLAENRLNRTAA